MDPNEGLLFDEQLPADHRSGFVALVGKPNVGKSTLLNAWLGYKIAAVSPKPQTTRMRLLGILTRPNAQAIFVDTPGIHQPRTKLGEAMVTTAVRAIPDADVVLFIVDVSEEPSKADRYIASLLDETEGPYTILVLNKADLLTPQELAARTELYRDLGTFNAELAISALTGLNRDELLEKTIASLPLGPRYYPADQMTDQEERFIAAELVREQALNLLQHEVPHAIAVVVDEFKERSNGTTYISATLYVERDSQKGIVIGRNGAMLKQLGREARAELEKFLDTHVYLELWVKVRKNWREDEQQLKQFGYILPPDD